MTGHPHGGPIRNGGQPIVVEFVRRPGQCVVHPSGRIEYTSLEHLAAWIMARLRRAEEQGDGTNG